MKISSIKIDNFRSIQQTEFLTTDFNIFVGQNNCEKTTILKRILLEEKIEASDLLRIDAIENEVVGSFYQLFSRRPKVNQYCVRDMKGQLIKEIGPLMPDIHYVIHTHDFPSGIYIIQFLKDGQVVKSEKIIVSH